MIKAGTRITFRVAGRTGGLTPINAGELKLNASDALRAWFNVISVDLVRPGAWEILDPSQWYYWDYSATVVAEPLSDYGAIDDLDDVVAHAFYLASDEIPTVTAPAYGEPEPGGVRSDPSTTPKLPEFPSLTLISIALIVVAGIVVFAVIKV